MLLPSDRTNANARQARITLNPCAGISFSIQGQQHKTNRDLRTNRLEPKSVTLQLFAILQQNSHNKSKWDCFRFANVSRGHSQLRNHLEIEATPSPCYCPSLTHYSVLTIHPTHTTLKCRVQDYFATLNASDYCETSLLFSEQGQLIPPFDDVVQGQDAIAHYLSQEALNMTCCPQAVEVIDAQQLLAWGWVQTPLFKVGVVWRFQFDARQHIEQVKIELAASFDELETQHHALSTAPALGSYAVN